MNKKEIRQLIKEQFSRVKEARIETISTQEAEELLRVYFRKKGGIPPNITKLSVIFPILEKIGFDDIVEVFIERAKSGDEEGAKAALTPVRKALKNIMDNPMGDPTTTQDDVEGI